MIEIIALDEKEINPNKTLENVSSQKDENEHLANEKTSFAIIKTGGKQLKVTENETIFIEKIAGNVNDEVVFSNVLLVNNHIGKPFVPGASVIGIIEKQGKQKKIVVYRHNAKSTHKRKYGHRQPYTRVLITKIVEKSGGMDHVKS